jgi:RNA polymerase sigma factor (TIGR02999 family)
VRHQPKASDTPVRRGEIAGEGGGIIGDMAGVTQILSQIELGDPHAAEQLLPLVYDELRKLARHRLNQEKPGQTLQATALVHEVYLRLVDGETAQHWNSRGHFFAAAAEAMRRILVENARRKKCKKHGGQLQRIALDELRVGVDSPPDELLLLDETLAALSKSDGPTAELVKFHCFAGLSIEQAADILEISHRTAYRDWAYARAWLFKRMEPGKKSSVT